MQPAHGSTEPARPSALRRWGPLAAIAVAVVAVIGVVLASGGGDDDEPAADSAPTDATEATGATEGAEPTDEATEAAEPTDDSTTVAPERPEGPLTFAQAEELGLEIDFGERCDPDTGRVRIPSFFAPQCFAPFDGDNGGSTAPGVSADTIRIVYWQAQENDPVLAYITDAIQNDDTNAQVEETLRALLPMYETYYETYGRSVEFIFFEGTGVITDPVSARADAVTIAEELDPFMVWSGPALTNAFAEELAARGIPCLGCGPGQLQAFYQEAAPLIHAITMGPQQVNLLVAEYVGKRLAGRPASHAGDEALQGQERVFGRLWIETDGDSVALNDQFESALGEYGVTLAESVSYSLNPATIQETAATVIARLKDAGVTTVLLSGDPVAPRDFTREATAQGYFPEWIISASVLMDTTVFARTYDQEQWANAFGLTTLAARVSEEINGPRFVYTWFNGVEPPADDSIGVLDPFPGLFYAALQGAGPTLTAQTFADALAGGEPTATAVTAPSISYGSKGRWPAELEPDFLGIDDVTEIWWDPEAVGIDELEREAAGMYQYVAGGLRYLSGAQPETDPAVFDPAGAVTLYTERPASEPVPTYDPLPAG